MIRVLENERGERACIANLKGWERVRSLDPVARRFGQCRVILSLPVTIRGAGINTVIRSTAKAFGCCYPDPSAQLCVVGRNGEVLHGPGDITALARATGTTGRTVMTALIRQFPLKGSAVVHMS